MRNSIVSHGIFLLKQKNTTRTRSCVCIHKRASFVCQPQFVSSQIRTIEWTSYSSKVSFCPLLFFYIYLDILNAFIMFAPLFYRTATFESVVRPCPFCGHDAIKSQQKTQTLTRIIECRSQIAAIATETVSIKYRTTYHA